MSVARRKIRRSRPACIEPLESRIAPAATVSVAGGNATVSDGNANAGDSITVSFSGGNLQFADPGGITAGGGAVQASPTMVTVGQTAISGTLSVLLGEGNNAVTFAAGLPSIPGLVVDTGTLGPLPALMIGPNALHITTAASDITIGGSISVAGDLTLQTLGTTANDINIGADLQAAGDVVLAAAGTITSVTGVTIGGQHVGLLGGGGVGTSGGAISVATGTLAASTGGTGSTGGVFLSNTGSLNIGVVTNSFLNLTITGVTASGPVSVTVVGFGALASITLAADVNAGGGTVLLSATGDIALGAQNISTTGSVTLTADSGSAGQGAITSGTGEVNASTLVASAAHGITLNTNVTSVSASNSLLNDISLNQAAGTTAALLTVNAGEANLDLNGGTFSLTTGSTINAGDVFVNGTLDLAGVNGSITGLDGTGAVTNSSATAANLTIADPGGGSTFFGVIGGNLGLIIAGPGTETLAGAGSYNGATLITGGTLAIQNLSALAGTSGVQIDGGTLDIGILNISVVNLTLSSGSIVGSGGSLSLIGTTGFDVVSGTISASLGGAAGLTKTGAGTVTLTGANTYTGSTQLIGGTLAIQNDSALSSLTNVGITGGTLDVGSSDVTVESVTLNSGSITGSSGSVSTLSGATVQSGTISVMLTDSASGTSLTKIGTGTVTLTGANTYSGGTTINAGTLELGPGGSLGNGAVIDNAVLALNRSDTFTLGNDVSGPGSIVQIGTGTASLAGDNTYTGSTTINAGILELQSLGNALNGPVVLAGGELLYDLPGAANQMSPTVVLTANALVGVAAGGEVDWNGTVSGAGFQFAKTGPGSLFSGTANFAVQSIDIQQGALGASTSGGLGSAPITVEVDAALWTANGAGLANDITLDGGAGASVSAPGAQPGALRNAIGGFSTFTGTIVLAGDSTIGTDGGGIALAGVVSGPGNLTEVGSGALILQNIHNSFGKSGTVTIDGGTVQISGDSELGNSGNSVVFDNGTLRTTKSFTTNRQMNLASGTATFDVTGILTLDGLVSGPGTLVESGGGTVLFGTPFTGTTGVSNGAITVSGTKVGITGAGEVDIQVVSNGHGGTVISSVELQDTDATTKLVITGPTKPGATVTLDQISSPDPNGVIGSIALGTSVILGDGLNDGIPAVAIAGEVDNLALHDVNAYATLSLGSGLPYDVPASLGGPDTLNNAPNIALRNILGPGVAINVTGDGLPDGVGGGGLGRVVVNSWPFAGTVQTTQSIGSFRLNQGNCDVVFLVGSAQNENLVIANSQTGPRVPESEPVTANIGTMTIANGAWGSSGSEIEGTVGTFSASSFLANATITAGNIARLLVRNGVYAGTTTLTDPDSSGLHTISVYGDFLGFVQTPASVINVSVRGDFKGSLEAASIGSISAYSFDGTTTGDDFGDPDRENIIAASGSLGKLTTSAGGIVNYEIAALTTFQGFNIKDATGMNDIDGLDNVSVEAGDIGAINVSLKAGEGVIGILDSTFETNSLGLGTILSVTSSHSVVDSIFAASTNIGPIKIGGTDPAATLTGSEILAGTSLAYPVLGGPMTDSYTRAGKIASVTVKGAVTATTIAVGINPEDGIYGDGDDLAAAGSPTTPDAIGALIFGAGSGTAAGLPAMPHDNAIEAASIKSLTIGAGPAIKNFLDPIYLELGDAEASTDILVERI